MQQILNYTTKVERLHHNYQEQGEINKYIKTEDFNKLAEELKDKVTNPENSATDNKVTDKEEKSEQHQSKKHKKQNKSEEQEKKIVKILEEEAHIDFKV